MTCILCAYRTPDGARPLAMAAAYDMDMRTAADAFKETGNEDLVSSEYYTADRAYPLSFSHKAVNASAYVHKTVFSAVQGREGMRANQLPVFQFG